MALTDHATGAPVGVPDRGDDGGELAAMHGLPERSDIRGRAITPGALHTVRATARLITERKGAACVFTGRANASKTHDTPDRIDRERERAMRRGCGQGARPDRTAPDRCPDPRSRNGHLARDPPGRACAAPAGERPAGRRGETGYRDLPLHNVARRGGRVPAGASGPDRGHWAVEIPTTACATRFPTGTPAGPAE